MTQLLLRSLNEVFFLFSFHSKHVAPDNRHTLLVWGRGITRCSALPACKLQQQFSQGFASLSRVSWALEFSDSSRFCTMKETQYRFRLHPLPFRHWRMPPVTACSELKTKAARKWCFIALRSLVHVI